MSETPLELRGRIAENDEMLEDLKRRRLALEFLLDKKNVHQCKRCGEPIVFRIFEGETRPFNLDGSQHWDKEEVRR